MTVALTIVAALAGVAAALALVINQITRAKQENGDME